MRIFFPRLAQPVVKAAAALLAFSPLPVAVQDWGAQTGGTAVRIVVIPTPGTAAKPLVEQDYEPNPAIWKLADEDTTIYLFGTIHLLPEGFRWRSAKLERTIIEADELVVETARSEIKKAGPILFMTAAMRSPDLPQISTQLSYAAAEKWLRLGELMRMPEGMIDRMNPLNILLGQGQLRSALPGSVPEMGVEAVLEPIFGESDRPVISIEKPVPIFKALAAIEDEIIIPELEQKLLRWDGESIKSFLLPSYENTQSEGIDWREVQHRWARGEPILAEHQSLEGSTAFERAIYARLFVDRNAAWTAWMIERLKEPGVVLVAVGVGHFYGEDSVISMLAKAGYDTPRVE